MTQDAWVIGLAVVLGLGTFGGFAIVALSKSATQRNLKRRVWAEGSLTTAKVVASRTNGSMNDHPYVEMTLLVGGRNVEVHQLISQLQVSKVAAGEEIAVKVDLLDPAVVVVDEALTPYGY